MLERKKLQVVWRNQAMSLHYTVLWCKCDGEMFFFYFISELFLRQQESRVHSVYQRNGTQISWVDGNDLRGHEADVHSLSAKPNVYINPFIGAIAFSILGLAGSESTQGSVWVWFYYSVTLPLFIISWRWFLPGSNFRLFKTTIKQQQNK